MKTWIYQQPGWPNLHWDNNALISLLADVRHMQGRIIGKMESLGFELTGEAVLKTLTLDILKSTEIEGLILNMQQVRSSIARRLGMKIPGLVASNRDVDGAVDMILDATQNSVMPLTAERLFSWQSSLFPLGRSGMYKIATGRWRDDSSGPMQVVSGALGKEKVHFQAPPAKDIDREMKSFLEWFNNDSSADLIIKAGIAHLWFVTIHPFEDGNGRIARAITDMLLSRSDGITRRFYSMSVQVRKERKGYYSILERTQKGTPDVTEWLKWFLECLGNAIRSSEQILEGVLFRHMFWNRHAAQVFNSRQLLMLNRLLDDFRGKLTTSKWAKIAKCSNDSALRDIRDLIDKKILQQESAGGRSTSYRLIIREE